MIQELKNGKFVILNGIVHTLTPLNDIRDYEKELRREAEIQVRGEIASEQLIRDLGRAGEFFTENGWRYFFTNKDASEFVLVAPFEGGEMTYEKDKRKFNLYIPPGWLGLHMKFNSFPLMNADWLIVPRVSTETFREMYTTKKTAFHMLHPHCFDSGRLCGGMSPPVKWDINLVVQKIKDCISGSAKKDGTSIWDYNPDSPATDIGYCKKGKRAFEFKKEGMDDDQIWQKVFKLRADQGE